MPEPLDVRVPPVSYRPHAKQRAFHRQRRKRFVSIAAGTRGGKTMAAAAEFAQRICTDVAHGKSRPEHGRGRDRRAALHYWVVSPVGWLLKEPKRYLQEMIPPSLLADPMKPINAEGQMWLKGGVLIEFKSADDPNKLVSVGLDGLWIDEAARLKGDAWRGNLRGRLTDHEGWGLFSSTPLGRNWFYNEVVQLGTDGPMADPQFSALTWKTIDNPHIKREEVEASRRQLPARYFQREYEADFSAFSGNVYEEFSDAHIFDEEIAPSQFRRVLIGLDFGWNAPGAAVVVGDLGGRYRVVEEVYATNMLFHDSRLASGTWVTELRRLIEKWRGSARSVQVIPDPSRPDLIHEMTRNGLYVGSADNDVIYGIRQVSTALHPVAGQIGKAEPGLKVHRSCGHLVDELRKYIWGVNRAGEFTEYPADGQQDHACVAEGTLILTPSGEVPVEQLAAGGVVDVLAYADGALVPARAAAFLTGEDAPLLSFVAGGRRMTGTPNHPILSEGDKWVRLGDLQDGARVVTAAVLDRRSDRDLADGPRVQRSSVLLERGLLPGVGAQGEERGRPTALACGCLGSGTWAGSSRVARSPQGPEHVEQLALEPGVQAARGARPGALPGETWDAGAACLAQIATRQGAPLWDRQAAAGGVARPPAHPCLRDVRQRVPDHRHQSEEHSVLRPQLQDDRLPSASSDDARLSLQALRGEVLRHQEWAPVLRSEMRLPDAVPSASSGAGADGMPGMRNHIRGLPGEVQVLFSGVQGAPRQEGKGRVFNLHVERFHTFVANGVVTHNCDALRYALVEFMRYGVLRSEGDPMGGAQPQHRAYGGVF